MPNAQVRKDPRGGRPGDHPEAAPGGGAGTDDQGAGAPRWVRRWAAGCGAAGAVVAVAILVGWSTGTGALRTLGVGNQTMSPVTAVLVIALAVAVVVWAAGPGAVSKGVCVALAGFVGAACSVLLVEQLAGFDTGASRVIWQAATGGAPLEQSRSELPTAPALVALVFLSFGVLDGRLLSSRRVATSGVLVVAGLAVAAQPVIGYMAGNEDFASSPLDRPGTIAPVTCVALLAVGGGALIMALYGPLRLLHGDTSAWKVISRLGVAAMAVPLARVVITQVTMKAGGWVQAAGAALSAALLAVLFAMVMGTGYSVWRLNRTRRLIIDRLPVAVMIDQNGVTVHSNLAAQRLFGLGPGSGAQDAGRPLPEDTARLLEVSPASLAALRAWAMDGNPVSEELNAGGGVGKDSQEERTLEVSAQSVDWDEQPATLLAVTDRTEHKTYEAAIRASRDASNRANEAKSEFLSRMSHELRTPLNAVIGFADLMRYRDPRPQDVEPIKAILKGGRMLLDLINEVLELSRIEAGKLSLSPEPVRLQDMVDEAVELIRPMAGTAIAMSCCESDAARDVYVLADRQRTLQVLLNLLSNAVKYNRPNGTVAVTCDAPVKGTVLVKVTDTGPGLRDDQIELLFEPFERLGLEEGPVEGTGIGLALSKRLTEAMGGKIGVVSTPGRGSTFSVELPLAENQMQRFERTNGSTHAEATSPAGAAAPAEPAAAAIRPVTVLHIEDNLASASLLERIVDFVPRPVELVSAMQGRMGLQLARDRTPDLVLLDLNLPDIDGDEVLAKLREDPLTADVPVVVISADATPGRINRLLNAGADEYLTKPVEVSKVLEMLRRRLPPEELDDSGGNGGGEGAAGNTK